MKIETKYELTDELYFIHNNKINSKKPIKINIRITNRYIEDTYNFIKEFYIFSIEEKSSLGVKSIIVELTGDEVFKTKEELLKSL